MPPSSTATPQITDPYHQVANTALDVRELETHVRLQDQQITNIQSDIGEIKQSLGVLLAKANEQGKFSLQSLGPLGALGGIVIAFLSMFISNQVSPIANQMTSLKETAATIRESLTNINAEIANAKGAIQVSVEKDAKSESDRLGLHDDVAALRATAGTNSGILQSMRAWMERSLTEIETQICSVEQTRNGQYTVAIGLMKPLWEKQGMGTFPTVTDVLPSICNRNNGHMP